MIISEECNQMINCMRYIIRIQKGIWLYLNSLIAPFTWSYLIGGYNVIYTFV